MPETFSFEEAAPPQTFSFEEAHAPVKRTREQVAASIPASNTHVPWYVAAGAAAEPWVRAATPSGLWQGVERAGAGLLNLPATIANAFSSPVETPFGSQAYEAGQLTQPRYALPFRPGQSVLPEQMRRPLQEDTGHAFTDVANQVINNLVEGGTTPGAVVAAPFAAAEGGAAQAAKTMFGLPMLEGAGEQAQQVFNPDLTPTQRTAAGVQAVLNTVMAGGALKDVGTARAQQLYPRGNEPTGVLPQEDPYANVSPWQRSVEQAEKRPAQAAPVILGEPQDQPVIKSINVFEGDDITPAYQAAGEPKQGGQVSFAAPAEAGAVPSARQVALPEAGADLAAQQHPQDALIAQVQRIVTTNDRLELNQLRNEVSQQVGQAAPGQREDALRLINQRQAELSTGAVNPEMQRLRNILERRQQAAAPQAQPPLYEVKVSPPNQQLIGEQSNAPRLYGNETKVSEEGLQQSQRGETLGNDLQRHAEAGQSPGGQQGVQEVRPLERGIHFVKSQADLENIVSKGMQPGPGMGNYVSFYHEGQRPRDFGIGRNQAVIIEFEPGKGGNKRYEGGIQKQDIKSIRVATPEEISSWGKQPIEQRGPLGGNVSTFGLLDPATWKNMGRDLKDAAKAIASQYETAGKVRQELNDIIDNIHRSGAGDRSRVVMLNQAADNIPLDLGRKNEAGMRMEGDIQFGNKWGAGQEEVSKRANEALYVYADVVANHSSKSAGLSAWFDAAKKSGNERAGELARFVQANWDKMKNIFDRSQLYDSANLADLRNSGGDVNARSGYIKRVVDVGEKQGLFNRPSFKGTGKSSKAARTYDKLSDLIADGYDLKSWDAAAMIGKRTEEIQREVRLRDWLNQIGKTPDSVTGKPITAPLRKSGTTHVAPPGYTEMNLGGARIAVLRGYESILDALTGTSRISGSRIGQAALQTVGGVKHGTLAVDLFHLYRLYQYARSIDPTGNYSLLQKPALSLLEYHLDDIKAGVKAGLIPKEWQDYAETKVKTPQFNDTRYALAEFGAANGLGIGRHSEALYTSFVRSFPGMKQTLGRLNRYIFDKVTRSAIENAFQTEFERLGNAHPDWSAQQVAQTVARDINFRFGNIQKQGLFKSRQMQDLMQLAFNAPRWVESMGQSEVRSATQLAKAVIPGSGSFGTVGTLGKSTSTLVAFYLLATQLANYLSTGHSTFENPEGHKLDAYIPPVTKDGRGYWVNALSVAAELTHDAIRFTEKGEESPVGRILANKASPHTRAAAALIWGKTWHGDVDGLWNRVKEAALQYNPTPIPLQSGRQALKEQDINPVVRQGFASLGVKAEAETKTEQTQRTSIGKTPRERVKIAQKKQVERAEQPLSEADKQSMAQYAIKQENRRREVVKEQISDDAQKWMQQQKLDVPTHELTLTLARQKIVLTAAEQQVYEKTLVEQYEKRIAMMRKNSKFSLLPQFQKQNVWQYQMEQAAEAARTKAKQAMQRQKPQQLQPQP